MISALIEAMPDAAVFAVDHEQRIVYWSPGAEALLGYRADEVVGEHCLKANRCLQCVQGCGIRERGEVHDAVLALHSRTDVPVHVVKTARGFFDEEGRFLGGVEVLRAAAHELVVASPAMEELVETLALAARWDVPILLTGERGVGKLELARRAHALSLRRAGPMVCVPACTLDRDLLALELRGDERRAGALERASGGTLIVHEIGELDAELEEALLRAMASAQVLRIGETDPRTIDTRIVMTGSPSTRLAGPAWRALHLESIAVPPLRRRREELASLAQALLWRAGRARGKVSGFSEGVLAAFLAYDWPGNIDELDATIALGLTASRGPALELDALPPEFLRNVEASRAAPQDDEDDPDRIRQAIEAANGHVGRAAARLGMSRATFWRRRKKLGV